MTGCSRDWISLKLVDENGEVAEEETPAAMEADTSDASNKSSAIVAVAMAFASMFM